ncbi:hypothetical protein [Mesorhizobium sp. M1365]
MLPKDKDDVVRPLALNDGLAVWSDGFELRIGNSLRRIDQGLANSHFGVVALSEPFERLDELRTRRNRRSSVKREQQLLPTWHKSPKALLPTRLTISDLITSVIAA